MTDSQPSDQPRRRSMVMPWSLLAIALVGMAIEYATINTWKTGDCNIDGALAAWGVFLIASLATPIATFVQQMRSPQGNRGGGQITALYVFGVVAMVVALLSFVPILFSDAC